MLPQPLTSTLFPYTTLFRSEEPHFYRLIVNENLSVPLVLGQGQSVKVNIDATGTEVTGSKDTDLLLEYETFRAASLERRSEEHTSELQSRPHLVCRLLLEKK